MLLIWTKSLIPKTMLVYLGISSSVYTWQYQKKADYISSAYYSCLPVRKKNKNPSLLYPQIFLHYPKLSQTGKLQKQARPFAH